MQLDAATATRRFLILRASRWFPTGLWGTVIVLLLLDRGLTLTQLGIAVAAQGVMVTLLELPTGGLADTIGRRPTLLLANVFELASLGLFIAGQSLWWFVAGWALQGVYRALDSGPLDAWFVDALDAAGAPDAVERALGQGGAVLGIALAAGAATSSVIVALASRLEGVDALVVPLVVALGLRVLDTALIARLMTEVRPSDAPTSIVGSARRVPAVVAGALRLLGTSAALRALVLVEATWGFGMIAVEGLFPPRLAEAVGTREDAAVLLGPVTGAAWVAAAAGAMAIPWFTVRFGRIEVAAAMRVLQGATVAAMGLLAGPVGLVAAYLVCFVVHGAANPVHQTLLHRQARSDNRATILSLNSMTASAMGAVGGLALGALADGAGLSAGFFVGAVVLAAAAPLYLVVGRSSPPDPETADTARS